MNCTIHIVQSNDKKNCFLCWLFAAGCLAHAPLATGSLTTTKSIVTIPIVTKHNTKVNTFCHKNTHPFGYYIWTNVTSFMAIAFLIVAKNDLKRQCFYVTFVMYG